MFLDVFDQVSVEHPFRNELEGSGSDTQEGDNVSVFQVFPHCNLVVEGLCVSSATTEWENDRAPHFRSFRLTILGVYVNAFDADLQCLTLKSPFVHLARTSRSDRLTRDDQKGGGKCI